MKKITYSGIKTREISFPLGGIGTGCIGLLGNGRLSDFEIFGKPNKKSLAGYSFFAVKAETGGKLVDARVLNSDSFDSRMGFDEYIIDINGNGHRGYGYGPAATTFSGVPHFPSADFSAKFPYAEMSFEYEKFPGKIRMTAFNPFIPMNESDSSIPCAMFEFEIENNSAENIDYTICGVLENPLSSGKNVFDGDMRTDMKCIKFGSYDDIFDDGALDSPYNAKNLCIATDCEDVSYQEYLLRGTWFDRLQIFWNNFTGDPLFKNRSYDKPVIKGAKDAGLVSAHIAVAPGEKKTVRFVISWYMRYMTNYWSPIEKTGEESDASYEKKNRWKNYYCRYFSSSKDAAEYCFAHWDRLRSETDLFSDSLYSSTLPDYVLDAVASNLCILKSPTLMRHSDGNIIGFEGCSPRYGSCEGNCTHVYNYAYALCHLFPELERGLRESEYNYSMNEHGAVNFRTEAPLGRKPSKYSPCADGQFGGIIKVYREFKISGNIKWLKRIWPKAKKSLDYAFSPDNPFRWDPEKTGILSGRQHNTLDTELYSPNSWLQGMYLAALKAAAEISEILGDNEASKEYTELYEKGRKYLNSELFNGKYFFQKINLNDRSLLRGFETEIISSANGMSVYDYYWYGEGSEIKYQIGEGSCVDQVLAQWHADNVGLGEIFDKEKTLSALKTIYDVNFKKSMRDFFNPCRNFCINDEGGVTICTYPEGAKKPKIPIPYAEECMNGFEYQAACHMIWEGMVDEGLEIVKAIRSRYDGEYRNPFSEMECGSDYVRSLASYSLLAALSGLSYDMYRCEIGFSPVLRFSDTDGYFRCFFAVGEAYGTVEIGHRELQMKILKGKIAVRKFTIHTSPKLAYFGGRKIFFTADGNTAVFESALDCDKANDIRIIFD